MINDRLFVPCDLPSRVIAGGCVLPLFAVLRLTVPLLVASSVMSGVAATSPAKGGVDEHTVALWLFDETSYPGTILTDASRYHHDLRLVTAYETWWHKNEHSDKGGPGPEALHVKGESGLVPGKFGNALKLPAGDGGAVVWPDHKQRYGSYFLLDRGSEVPERLNLGYLDWTLELWFKGTGTQDAQSSLFELRNEDHGQSNPMLNAIKMVAGRKQFTLISKLRKPQRRKNINIEIAIPTDAVRLNDGEWHHLAFTYTSREGQMRHYVDGQLQSLPAKGGFLPMMGVVDWLSLTDPDGTPLHAMLDEMRISDVVRYTGNFTPPGTFSKNYASTPREVNKPNGPPLLFGPDRKAGDVIPLGSRKHVFIDDALIEQMSDVAFTCNPPTHQETDFVNTQPWEPTARMGSTIPDVCSVWDEGDEIRMLYSNGGMWSAKPHVAMLATSKDGLHWIKPNLGLHEVLGTVSNNVVMRYANQGSVIKDPNPAAPPEEKYKYVAWGHYWGFFAWTSPDGIHWKRNETCALPFDPDGSSSFYWDDQRGLYQAYCRVMPDNAEFRRQTGRFIVPEILKPWPFKKVDRPDMGDMLLAKPTRGEVPIVDTGGEVYRFKAHKYAWAPDVYLAFPWRYVAGKNIRPGSFLMVSRDGENWKRYENPYYFASSWKFKGREVLEALTEHGLIRRGNEIWQYGTVRFTEHGGALYGGVEHEGGIHDRLLRLSQRLDGFVSLDAGEAAGTVVTKPLKFSGNTLELNLAAKGEVRVELQDEAGQPLRGFELSNCDPIRGDHLQKKVTWKGKSNVKSLEGKTVRVRFQLQQAKLYACQFVP